MKENVKNTRFYRRSAVSTIFGIAERLSLFDVTREWSSLKKNLKKRVKKSIVT